MSTDSVSTERIVGQVERAFYDAGVNFTVAEVDGEVVASARVKGERFEGASLRGREDALRDLLADLPDGVADRVLRTGRIQA